MKYIVEILWLLSWPTLIIYGSYRLALYVLKKLDLYDEPKKK